MRRFVAISMIVLSAAIGAGCSSESSRSGDEVAGMLDPEPYRARIDAVESVLYQPTPAGFGDIDRAGAALLALHEEILKQEENRRVRSAANELLFLSARADVSDAGYTIPDLHAVRAAWERSRTELFGESPWFRSTTPDLVASQTAPAPSVSPADKENLIRSIDRLTDLIAEGRRECDVLGEPVYEPGMESREGKRQIEAWRQFYREWDDRLNSTARGLPPAPPLDGVTDYVVAYQNVQQAIGDLRQVPVGVGAWATPFEYQWVGRLNAARDNLDDARTTLATLP